MRYVAALPLCFAVSQYGSSLSDPATEPGAGLTRAVGVQACADVDEAAGGNSGGNTRHFAHINSAVGIGLAIGSGFGGQLSFSSAARLASLAYVLAAVIVFVGLVPIHNASRDPEQSASGRQRGQHSTMDKKKNDDSDQAGDGEQTLSIAALGILVVMRLLFSSCATGQRETFALAVKDRMNMSEGWIGAFLSYKGVVAMFANSMGLVPLLASKRWASNDLLMAAALGLAMSYLLSATALHTSSSALLAFTQMPLTITTNVCRTLLQVTKHLLPRGSSSCFPFCNFARVAHGAF
eukprot:COSAG02_NODE_908_length_16032_cov_53.699931_5_plen_294_part_00